MPKVPRINPNQVQENIGPDLRTNIQTSTETFGGGQSVANVNRAAQGLFQDLGRQAEKVKKKAFDTQFFEGDSQLSKIHVDSLSSMKSRKGKGSIEFQQDLDNFKKSSEEIIKNYKGEEVQFRLRKSLQARMDDLYRDGTFHMNNEVEKYENDTYKSYVSNARDEAVFDYKDPEKINLSLFKQSQAIQTYAENNGLPPDQTKALLDEAKSQTHLQVISRMINNGEDIDAKEYHKKVKSQFTGEDSAVVDKLMKSGILRGESQRRADLIFSKTESMSEALEKARDINDPKLRDETVSRVKQRFQEKRAAKKIDTDALYDRAGNTLDQNPDVDQIP